MSRPRVGQRSGVILVLVGNLGGRLEHVGHANAVDGHVGGQDGVIRPEPRLAGQGDVFVRVATGLETRKGILARLFEENPAWIVRSTCDWKVWATG